MVCFLSNAAPLPFQLYRSLETDSPAPSLKALRLLVSSFDLLLFSNSVQSLSLDFAFKILHLCRSFEAVIYTLCFVCSVICLVFSLTLLHWISASLLWRPAALAHFFLLISPLFCFCVSLIVSISIFCVSSCTAEPSPPPMLQFHYFS